MGEERAVLLRQITEEGGFAFVSSVEKAAAGDLRAAEAAREMAWEQLHSGPWHEVVAAWRDAYAMACLHVAEIKSSAGETKEALKALDMGLIMGGPLLRADLDSAIDRITNLNLQPRQPSDAASGSVPPSNPAASWQQALCTNKDIQEAIRVLPRKSLSGKKIERRELLSFETFIGEYFIKESPIIITGCMNEWPACTKWKDINYLIKVAGDRTVPVEVGKNYVCTDWKQELITFSQLLERISNNNNNNNNTTYLAQHPLFDQIRQFKEDIMIPEYCYAGGGEIQSVNAWFGPSGTVTPLHHDPHHNILAQVVGRKYVRLYDAGINEDLYPHEESMLCNTSRVDLDHVDQEDEFAKVGKLEFVDCVLEEGEMLYIPPKWWHYVKSLSTSFSVSFWWSATPNNRISS